MAQPSPDRSWDADDVDELRELPFDPDVETDEDARHRPPGVPTGLRGRERASRWPRIHWTSVVMVAAGAFFGGTARYAVDLTWPTPAGTFPWNTFGVNTAGAFILGLLLVLVLEVLPPTTHLRTGVGTGFCGALTTFSSNATAVDLLAVHGHPGLAAGYVVASVVAGLAAASFGVVLGRSIAANREKGRE